PRAKTIRKLANQIEQAYPASYFGTQTEDLSPMDWAQESYLLDKTVVYHIKPNAQPTATYIAKGQVIAEQRIALAGYRLANVLNQIFI
ncbi:MAG: S1/P1 nuclease, partial [Gammaproteobacteria bacterium]